MASRRAYRTAGAAFVFLATGLTLAVSLSLTGGRLFYGLDDAYIHLSVAETILAGGYGVNAGEYASPSSSILWPWLVAGLMGAGLGIWAPLVLGTLGSAAALWVLCGAVWDHAVDPSNPASVRRAWTAMPLLALALHAVGLPMIGMEHPLHVLAAVLTMSGLARLDRDGPLPSGLTAGIVLGPLVRFEGLALSAAAILALLWHRRFGAAALSAALVAAGLAAFVACMSALGLPPLPSSVMVKSASSAAAAEGNLAAVLSGLLGNLTASLASGMGVVLAALGYLILRGLLRPGARTERTLTVAAAGLATIAAHLVLGRFGEFPRYEIYAVGAALVALLVLYGPEIRAAGTGHVRPVFWGFALLGGFALVYGRATLLIPAASRNVMLQQYQMHRFATEFLPATVAVNDLGYVSFRNGGYVLDLWGLGSEEARRALRSGDDPEPALARLAAEKGAGYAMIYDTWFGDAVPDDWCRAATISTPAITASQDTVTFYLIDPALAAPMDAALRAFAPTLPDGAALEIGACGG